MSLYTELLKRVLTRTAFDYEVVPVTPQAAPKRLATAAARRVAPGVEFVRRRPIPEVRASGGDWPPPPDAETMVGLRRLDNLEELIRDVVRNDVMGDVLEAGVWRGGACILARAVLRELGVTDRTVWLADSFRGLPEASTEHDRKGPAFHKYDELAVPLEEVQRNFERYGLLDDRVRFLVGWFSETLPGPVERLAILRADGDMYESTMDVLGALYDCVSVGGYVIIDDYGSVRACTAATNEFRAVRGITDPLIWIDKDGVYWQKT
jgi:O-methyltransferase